METLPETNQISTTKTKGDTLESAIEHIFKMANFTTERNVIIASYEIDVKATIGDRTIIIECKNYQNSTLTIRNLIHQWNSKNQLIGAHKIILVLAGVSLKDSDYSLASEFDMELWNQEDITDFFNLSLKPDALRERLLSKISLKPITIAERYREDITYLVIKPQLSDSIITDEEKYNFFNKWLRAHILTEMQLIETTKEERAKHIELFEGSKTKKGFLNITKKRKEAEYWNTVYEQLKQQTILGRERQDDYIKYMDSLHNEYISQQDFFKGGDFYARIKKLITSRLRNAVLLNEECKFTTYSFEGHISIKIMEAGSFSIHVSSLNRSQGNVLNWILTSHFIDVYDKTTGHYNYYWICSSLHEAAEKIYRILTEYYDIPENANILDLSLR